MFTIGIDVGGTYTDLVAIDADGNTDVITAAMPPEMIPSVAAPSLLAHIVVESSRA